MIEYHCNSCRKKFKPKDYMRLEIISSSVRRCDSCGGDIKVEDKIVKA